MKISKLIEANYLEEILQDVLADAEEMNDFEAISAKTDKYKNILEYYKDCWLTECKNLKWLNKEILYKEFLTRNCLHQKDHWILLGIKQDLFNNKKYVVWWNYTDKMLSADQTIEEFYEDLSTNTYKIISFKNKGN